MLNLMDSVRGQCNDLDAALLDMHFRRLPATYFERYSPAEVARHLRLMAGISTERPVDLEIRALTSRAFEVAVVGIDYSGTLACITGALAGFGFDLEDAQVSPYLDSGTEPGSEPELKLFVIVLRVSGGLPGRSLSDFTVELGDRLRAAFEPLAQGNLLEAQTLAAGPRAGTADTPPTGPERTAAQPANRPSGYEGLVLGGDFRMDRKLATGGMSEVYLATQTSLNRTVAMKVFRHEGSADDELLTRINNEALVLAQFSSAHIVQILAAGTHADQTGGVLGWMAMEYMAGGDLGQWLQDKGPPSKELGLRWFSQALEGLQYAHRHNILHRDLKPHNLLLTAEGNLKVSDFGLLKQARQLASDLTPQSGIVGTPLYMSPEQALGEPLDERSDVFSLGTAFFYILSGRLPFQGSTATAVLVQIAQLDAPKLVEVAPNVPLPMSVIISRMMARQREARYQDVSVILEDLASYERRGLLSTSPTGTFAAVPPPAAIERPEVETQAYQPSPERMDDL